MPSTTNRKVADLLDQHEAELVAEWVKAQLAALTLRSDLMKEGELRAQSARFVHLLREVLSSGASGDIVTEAWAPVRDFLEDISVSRARQGFRAAETATFIFSLKEPLFARLLREPGDAAAAAGDIWSAIALLDQLGLYVTEAFQRAREGVIRRQQDELLELSTPVVEIWRGVLALPLIGTLDSERTQRVMESLLGRIVETGAEIAIVDITGVPTVDTLTAQHLIKTVAATRLLGAECIISGVRPAIAQTLVQLGINLGDVRTKAKLAGALALAFERTGRKVVKQKARR
ncbi:MAG: STAS domain-containing protein [Polyangiaceae bacterium]|jgi:rsbT co-antagonist protein RsbR|nr:STAS domain-containing protein [Polyangiaceae bacterium]